MGGEVDEYLQKIKLHSVHPLPPPTPPHPLSTEGLSLRQIFQKGRGLMASQFLEGVAGKEGVTFFRAVQFFHKNLTKISNI